MNCIIITQSDLIEDGRARLTGRRLAHVLSVHRAVVGDTLRVGLLHGKLGNGTITAVNADAVEMTVRFDREPPQPLPAVLVMGLPRPKSMRKVLHVATTMGVKELHFINAHRVEKSYWSSPRLGPEQIEDVLILGLEQAVDTILPRVSFHRRIRWFVEDNLPGIAEGKRSLIAHPPADQPCPRHLQEPSVLALGPEGGFVDYEVGYFTDAGFEAVTMGPRILRVEEAVPALLGRLY
ncbi:MAG: 16S rRNA (uracil(1498)-N(3))-methyltransferase [Chitinivibrionales bacterium]|nr:16S rRNA (uracil(1498)-N(3))-methyltransferase [Chitinivibrionales bacterium]